jgi:hypothetical protein
MRAKFIFCLIFLVYSGFAGFAGTVVKTFEFSHPVIEKTGIYSVISFNGTHLLGETGKATLPFYPVKLLLPPGEIAISISIKFEDPFILPGEFNLLPRQETRPLSEGENGHWLMDQDFYQSSKAYPSAYQPGVKTHFLNGCGIALSAFTPLRYVPSKKEVSYFQRIIVTIQTGPDPGANEHQRNFYPSEKKAKDLAGIVQNPESISRYFSGRDLRTNDYDYLIITNNNFLTEFDALASFYKPRGIRTKVTATEYISTNVIGNDLQEKIRNYIISEYQANGIEYVLIGGDVEIVPYRGFYCYVVSGSGYEDYNIPSDLYYSALDGNWNTDGDGRWAEPGEDDLYPEVAVGRMTFSDTAELHNMLHKTMLYQDNPVEGELTKPLLAGEHLWGPPEETWGSDYMKLLVGYRTDNGYTTSGIPNTHPRDTLYDRYAYWSKATLISHINAGRPWVHHCGHANSGYVMKLYNSDITNANFSQANGVNHNYTIVYTHGCICGAYDNADCIGEKMIGIDNFAVAFVGNSRYGWFNQGTTDGPSEHLHREFVDALYRDSLYHIGMAHLRSKSETAPFVDLTGEFEPGATRWCFYDNHVLGDPMMACWTEEPGQLAAGYPSLIQIGAPSISVQLNGPSGTYNDFTCSVYRNDTLFGSALTNASGAALILLDDNLSEGQVSLIVTGYNIIPHYFDIQVCNYWLGWTTDWNDEDNWYTGSIPDSSSYVIIPANPAGSRFPLENSGTERQCQALKIEPGALFNIGAGETFSVGGD